MLSYCPLEKRRKVEVSDETGFYEIYYSIMEVVKDCGISNSSAIKCAIDHERPFVKKRSIKKMVTEIQA